MEWDDLERHFSSARLGRYCAKRNGDKSKAAADYLYNILLAEALFPMLNLVEISFRNAVNTKLNDKYKEPAWWNNIRHDTSCKQIINQVEKAIKDLSKKEENTAPSKVVAELTFGFWSTLFNSRYQKLFWQDLRLAFPHCPKPERQRKTISTQLNKIRKLRNRVFHHEPLLWLTPSLLEQYQAGITLLNWIDPKLNQ